MTEQFDHHTTDFAQTFTEVYARLRSEEPVAHTTAHGGFSVVTRHEDVIGILCDQQHYSCARDLQFGDVSTGGVTVPVNAVRMGMMEMDPPESHSYRKVLAPHFSKAAVNDYLPRMRTIVSWAVDQVIESGSLDFVDDLSNPIPALITLDMLGLPLERWRLYADALHKAAYREKGSGRIVAELLEDLRSTIAQGRTSPESTRGVLRSLLNADVDGTPLDDEIVTEMIFMLLNGGVDTTTALIANMFHYLGDHPELHGRLREDLDLVPRAVDEMLRFLTPGTAVARTVVVPTTVAGTELLAGVRLLLALGAANHDERVFGDPESVLLDRANSSKHLSFGFGVHRCLGAFLAPMEMGVVLHEVLTRVGSYRIDEARAERYPTIPLVNGYIRLPASFAPGVRCLPDLPIGELLDAMRVLAG